MAIRIEEVSGIEVYRQQYQQMRQEGHSAFKAAKEGIYQIATDIFAGVLYKFVGKNRFSKTPTLSQYSDIIKAQDVALLMLEVRGRRIKELESLAGFLKKEKYDYLRAQAEAADNHHKTCVRTFERLPEPVFILNRRGTIRGQSEEAIRVYGDMRGSSIKRIISGTDKEVREVFTHFNPAGDEEKTGWIYTFVNGKEKAAQVEIIPQSYLEHSGEKERRIRHSVIIRVLKIRGFLYHFGLWGKHKPEFVQDRLRRDIKTRRSVQKMRVNKNSGLEGLAGA
jgi:hypothetical protein